MSSAARRLRANLDVFGWRAPFHRHFRVISNGIGRPQDPSMPPVCTELCTAAECEAEGCPRTESGFPREAGEAAA